MNAIAINGSPRKNKNTATLLSKALEGARSRGGEGEIIHLYDLNYKGCISCFACKRKNNGHPGKCAMKDDLTPVLEATQKADVLLLGSPIYLSHVTGEMASFLERLIFPNIVYAPGYPSAFKGKLASGFIYTMNMTKERLKDTSYEHMFMNYERFQKAFNGTAEYMVSLDTFQFDDYSLYDATLFDPNHKAQVKAEQFPLDCQASFEMGARLVENWK